MEKGLVSVIITTYCRDFNTLGQAIDSVLSQTYDSIEVIIVDDNKPDSPYSAEITARLATEYPSVIYVKMEKNSGACAARNAGIMESKGEFCAFLDDDDLWVPEKCARQVECFCDPDVGLVFCQGLIFKGEDRENTTPYYTTKEFYTNPGFSDMLKIDRVGSTSQAMIRKSCFYFTGMFDSLLPARQDYEMWLRLTKYGYTAAGVAEALFYHRLHEGDQITKIPKKALDGNMRLLEKYRRDFKNDREARFIIYTTIGQLNIRCKKRVRGLWFYLKALLIRPVYFVSLAAKAIGKAPRDYSVGR